jgi:hypothetical protein
VVCLIASAATAQVRVHFGVDAGVPTNISTSQGYSSFSFTQTIANRWQFPLLVQYRRTLPKTKTALFAEAGLSISHITNGQSVQSETTISNSSPSSGASSFSSSGSTSAGIVAAAGADFPLFHGHLRPELRYTHWFAQSTENRVRRRAWHTA